MYARDANEEREVATKLCGTWDQIQSLLSQVKTNMRHMEILRKEKLRLNLRKVTRKDFFYFMDEAKKLCFSIFLKENDFLWNL